MNYLKRVSKTMQDVTWERFDVAFSHTMRSLLVIGIAAMIYWGIDELVMKMF